MLKKNFTVLLGAFLLSWLLIPSSVQAQPACHPVLEICDGHDNDCDRQIDEEGVVVRDDGNFCTQDLCQNGQSVHPANNALNGVETPKHHDDPCWHYVCQGGLEVPQARLQGDSCDDGNRCTKNEKCNAAQRCVEGEPICDDGNPCTTDTCARTGNETEDPCGHENVPDAPAIECDRDRNECTKDTCQDGECKLAVDNGVLNACGECGPAPVEVCDERDNDCDGAVDEGVKNACGLCGAVPREVCDGRDNNCDGTIDEGVKNACGLCGPVPTEVCDERDNDCDGAVDEGVKNACGLCGAVPVEVCDGRDNDCDRQTDEGVKNACGRCGPVPAEVCDGVDNNCDGTIDEGVKNACGLCGAVPAEVCDGRDNDCDGTIDDGVKNACGLCGAVPAEVCDGVDNNCNGAIDEGVKNACGRCGAVPAEICNGIDDDCDGTIDEGVKNACGGCGVVSAEVCDGVDNNCNGAIDDGVKNACGRCGPVPVEACDGADNDCNGQTDENLDRRCGDTDVGACSFGMQSCQRGAFGACIGLVVPAAEVCNGLDDDCDGQIDEDPVPANVNLCTRDSCVNGQILHTAIPNCCNNDAQCRNNNACDGIETCSNHVCVPGVPSVVGACAPPPAPLTCNVNCIPESVVPVAGQNISLCIVTHAGGSPVLAFEETDPHDAWCADFSDVDPNLPLPGVQHGVQCFPATPAVPIQDGMVQNGTKSCWTEDAQGQNTLDFAFAGETPDQFRLNNILAPTTVFCNARLGKETATCQDSVAVLPDIMCPDGKPWAKSLCAGLNQPSATGAGLVCTNEALAQVLSLPTVEKIGGFVNGPNKNLFFFGNTKEIFKLDFATGLITSAVDVLTGDRVIDLASGPNAEIFALVDHQIVQIINGGAVVKKDLPAGDYKQLAVDQAGVHYVLTAQGVFQVNFSPAAPSLTDIRVVLPADFVPEDMHVFKGVITLVSWTQGKQIEWNIQNRRSTEVPVTEAAITPAVLPLQAFSLGAVEVCEVQNKEGGGSLTKCEPAEEVCDGLDNDCDGLIDEDLVEVCDDGKDNDCDGLVDEDCGCAEGATQVCGQEEGECAPGVQRCVAGVFSDVCEGAIGPTPEICGDGLDNDCDGLVDEDCKPNPDGGAQPAGAAPLVSGLKMLGSGLGGCSLQNEAADVSQNSPFLILGILLLPFGFLRWKRRISSF